MSGQVFACVIVTRTGEIEAGFDRDGAIEEAERIHAGGVHVIRVRCGTETIWAPPSGE